MPAVAAGLTVILVMTVPVMHEEVHEGAREQEQVRERSQDVGLMFVPEEEHGDRSEQAGAHPEKLEGGRFGGHAFRVSSSRASRGSVCNRVGHTGTQGALIGLMNE
jgi:hypothetical protein